MCCVQRQLSSWFSSLSSHLPFHLWPLLQQWIAILLLSVNRRASASKGELTFRWESAGAEADCECLGENAVVQGRGPRQSYPGEQVLPQRIYIFHKCRAGLCEWGGALCLRTNSQEWSVCTSPIPSTHPFHPDAEALPLAGP